MVSASLVCLGSMMLLNVEAKQEFVARIPNGANVEGYAALGHTDGTGRSDARNAFGNAFDSAGQKWTLDLCQADTDGDGQRNGQELGDPCCEWTQSSGASPRWTTGVSHPSDAELTSNASLWENINCSAVTDIISAISGADPDNSKLPSVQSIASIIAVASAIALVFN